MPAGAIVRALPNLPVAIGQGVTLLHGDAGARRCANALATPLGLAEWIDDEALFDAATALAGQRAWFPVPLHRRAGAGGCGDRPAAGQAARLAQATVTGSAVQAGSADVPPGELARRVASKGGSTQAGYDVLDADGALVDLLTPDAGRGGAAQCRDGRRGAR